jgi:exonuclease SbcC
MEKEFFIKKIEINNFQSHTNSTIELTNGINVLTGSSNNGKSAILRAIQWVVTNTPTGTDFINLNHETASVTLYLSNGYSVTRTKSKSGNVNTYEIKLNGIRTTADVLTGFGKGVPIEVREALGFNRPEFNFSNQLESAFLISDSPKDRAETIGNLDELGTIDKALTETNDDIRLNQRQLKTMDSEMKKNLKEISDLDVEIKKRNKFLKVLNRLKEEIEEIQKRVEQSELSLSKLRELKSETLKLETLVLKSNKVLSEYDDALDEHVRLCKHVSDKKTRLAEIQNIINGFNHLEDHTMNHLTLELYSLEKQFKAKDSLNEKFGNLSEIERKKIELKKILKPNIANIETKELDQLIATFKTLKDNHTSLQDKRNKVQQLDKEANENKETVVKLVDELIQVLQDEKTCPVCTQNTEHVHININNIIGGNV